jgi:Mn-dependent DtxR family transcriptional regulator
MKNVENIADRRDFEIREEWQEALQAIWESLDEKNRKEIRKEYETEEHKQGWKTALAILKILIPLMKTAPKQADFVVAAFDLQPHATLANIARRINVSRNTAKIHFKRLAGKFPWITEIVGR